MIRAVVFDLDGTLLDRDASLLRFLHDQYDRIGDLQRIERQLYIERFVALDMGGYVWKDRVYQQLIAEFALEAKWQPLLTDYLAHFQHHCVGFPNVHTLLHQLRDQGMKLGIITNGFGQFQTDNITKLGIADLFDHIIVSEWEGLRKPDPLIFIRMLERLGVRAEEAAFVGDHPQNDVAASRAVGMRGIWKEDNRLSGDFERDGVISDLLELIPLLEAYHSKGA